MSKYIVLDVETTGLPKNYNASPILFKLWPHIVQFSWIVCNDDKTEEKSFIIKPNDYVIPEESTKIHNISNKDAIQNGVSLQTVLDIFIKDCNTVNYIVAHNATFDTNVILAACYKKKYNVDFLKDKNKICTMKSSTPLCKLPGKYGYKYPKLEELFFYLFNENPNTMLHNSLEDAKLTLKCYKELQRLKIKMV